MTKATLIAGTNGHDTVTRTSKASPARPDLHLTHMRRSVGERGAHQSIQQRPGDWHVRGDARARDIAKRGRLQILEDVGVTRHCEAIDLYADR